MEWSAEEIALLRSQYRECGKEINQLLEHHTVRAIYSKARELGLQCVKGGAIWQDWELQILQEKYPVLGLRVAELLPNRSIDSIKTKAYDLNIKVSAPRGYTTCSGRSGSWQSWELELLQERYPIDGVEIPELIDRHGKGGVYGKAHKLGLSASCKWTPEELQILRDKFPRQRMDIPELLVRHTRISIQVKASVLGLLSDDAPVARVLSRKNPNLTAVSFAYKGTDGRDYYFACCHVCETKILLTKDTLTDFVHGPLCEMYKVPCD